MINIDVERPLTNYRWLFWQNQSSETWYFLPGVQNGISEISNFFYTSILAEGCMFYCNPADAEGRKPHLFAAPTSVLLSTRFLEHLWIINNKREKVISLKYKIGLCINCPCLRLVINRCTNKNNLRNVCKTLDDCRFSLGYLSFYYL